MKNTNKNNGKISLHLSKPVVDFAVVRADARFEGNISRYVRDLIQRDMRKQKVAA